MIFIELYVLVSVTAWFDYGMRCRYLWFIVWRMWVAPYRWARGWRIAQSVPRQLTLVLLEEHLRSAFQRHHHFFSSRSPRKPPWLDTWNREVSPAFNEIFFAHQYSERKQVFLGFEEKVFCIIVILVFIFFKLTGGLQNTKLREFLDGFCVALYGINLKYSTTRKSIWNFIPSSTRLVVPNLEAIDNCFNFQADS